MYYLLYVSWDVEYEIIQNRFYRQIIFSGGGNVRTRGRLVSTTRASTNTCGFEYFSRPLRLLPLRLFWCLSNLVNIVLFSFQILQLVPFQLRHGLMLFTTTRLWHAPVMLTLPQFQQLNTLLIRDFVAFVSSSSLSSDVERATVDRMLVCLPRFLCDSADGPVKHDCCVELSAAGSRLTRTWWCRDGREETSGHREISDCDAVKSLILCVDKQSTSTHCEWEPW